MTFSIAIIARNEAAMLPRLLRSLESFRRAGGSILVLDTGSEDSTRDVARDLGCSVVTAGDRFTSRLSPGEAERIECECAVEGDGPLVAVGQRVFDFAAARQEAGRLAAHDFVWQLDASDEVLTMDLDRVQDRIVQGGIGGLAYRIRLGGGSFEARRFYDRRHYEWRGRTHEGLYPSPHHPREIPPPTVPCADDEVLVVHHRQEKERNYLAGLALEALASPAVARWWHYLGRELFYAGWHRSAVKALEHHVAMPDADPIDRCQSLCAIAACLDRLGESRAAEAALDRATHGGGGLREPWLRLATVRAARGDFCGAADCARRALAIETRARGPESDTNYTWRPHAVLYWSLFWLGERDAARHHWEICRTFTPMDPTVFEHGRLFGIDARSTSGILLAHHSRRSSR